jgi:nitrate/nitrite transport system substrate-binding protein
MSTKSLGNPYDPESDLSHSRCDHARGICHHNHAHQHQTTTDELDEETIIDRAVESAVVRGIFQHNEMDRRRFLKLIGGGTFAAALSAMFPMDALKAAVKDSMGPLEKKKLSVGFVPITCATPSSWPTPWASTASMGSTWR